MKRMNMTMGSVVRVATENLSRCIIRIDRLEGDMSPTDQKNLLRTLRVIEAQLKQSLNLAENGD